MGEVETLCPRVIIISKGKLVADSPTNELRERVGNSLSLNLTLGGAGISDAQKVLSKIDGVCGVTKVETAEKIKGERKLCAVRLSVKENAEVRKEIFDAAVKNKWTIYEMGVQKNSLEDVFHALTQGKEEK